MKILVVCQYYYPENFQITPVCEQLVKDGYDVTVLTGLPNYPLGVVPEEYKKGHRDEWINGVHVVRVHEIGRKKGAFHLALNYISFWLSASRKINELPGDCNLVFVYQLSPVMMGLPAIKYAKKHNVPMLLYCCDLWPESMKIYLKSEKNPVFRYFKRLSRRVYHSSDYLFAQSTSFVDYLSQIHGLPLEKIAYLPAFADEQYLLEDFTPQDDTIDFVFLGNLGIAQDLIKVLSAVEKIKDIPNFKVHFVGDGSMFEAAKAFVDEKGLTHIVQFYGRRPVEEMPEFYRLADACLVSLNMENQIGLTLPSKVQGYMAAGKPIIGMINGSARDVIVESKCGVCVDSGDVDGLANAMRDFILNNDNYKDCGENARQYFVDNFRKHIFMSVLEDKINEMEKV
ncbi:MAG: glycosyltransferase family 4 protein [Clostridia bacterium]|nr:glycosyltransferase family 4 protein [Clostridia bacterium]